jgi:hypothetical protein
MQSAMAISHASASRMKKVPVILLTAGVATHYAWHWGGYPEDYRPFIYRQFVPVAARAISFISGLAPDHAVVVTIILCALGFVFASYYLFSAFYPMDPRANWFVLVMVLTLFVLASYPKHTYDIPTGMFFALALALLQRRHLHLYAGIFPLICLNRETAFLLPILFGVYFYRKLDRRSYWFYMIYQGMVYLTIRVVLAWAFADTPGHPFAFRLVENLERYASGPFTTQIFLLFLVALTFILVTKWRRAPVLMRTGFLVFTPLLVVLYFCFGWSFEVRVFIELIPIIGIISASG